MFSHAPVALPIGSSCSTSSEDGCQYVEINEGGAGVTNMKLKRLSDFSVLVHKDLDADKPLYLCLMNRARALAIWVFHEDHGTQFSDFVLKNFPLCEDIESLRLEILSFSSMQMLALYLDDGFESTAIENMERAAFEVRVKLMLDRDPQYVDRILRQNRKYAENNGFLRLSKLIHKNAVQIERDMHSMYEDRYGCKPSPEDHIYVVPFEFATHVLKGIHTNGMCAMLQNGNVFVFTNEMPRVLSTIAAKSIRNVYDTVHRERVGSLSERKRQRVGPPRALHDVDKWAETCLLSYLSNDKMEESLVKSCILEPMSRTYHEERAVQKKTQEDQLLQSAVAKGAVGETEYETPVQIYSHVTDVQTFAQLKEIIDSEFPPCMREMLRFLDPAQALPSERTKRKRHLLYHERVAFFTLLSALGISEGTSLRILYLVCRQDKEAMPKSGHTLEGFIAQSPYAREVRGFFRKRSNHSESRRRKRGAGCRYIQRNTSACPFARAAKKKCISEAEAHFSQLAGQVKASSEKENVVACMEKTTSFLQDIEDTGSRAQCACTELLRAKRQHKDRRTNLCFTKVHAPYQWLSLEEV